MSNGMCFERYYNQVGMSASTILPPPLKHDTSCLMGCLLNDTVIKWACLLAAPHPPLKHDTSCLPHSLPTHEDWYIWKKSSQFIAKNQSFWKHSNIMRFLLASLSDPVWSFNDCNIFRWYYIGKFSLILEPPPLASALSAKLPDVILELKVSCLKWACLLAPSPPQHLKHDTSCLCVMGCVLNDTIIKWACLLAPSSPHLWSMIPLV